MSAALESRAPAADGAPVDPLRDFGHAFGEVSPSRAMTRACSELLRAVGQHQPPFGVEGNVLKALRAEKRAAPLVGIHGALEIVGGTYRVLLPEELRFHRRRFTVAHEVAHMIVLDALADHPEALRSLRRREWLAELERLCDIGAAELLMPRDSFVSDLTGLSFAPADLEELFLRYCVSWEALLRRFSDVLPGAAVSIWKCGTRSADEPTLPRVVRSYGQSGAVWLPHGLSPRYLSHDVIGRAMRERTAAEPDLRVDFSSSPVTVRALATRIPAVRYRTPDREGSHPTPGDVALLLLPAGDEALWTRLRGYGQLELPFDSPPGSR